MTDYFVDSRAAGANDGAAGDADANTKNTNVIDDAWQSLADITGLLAGDTVTLVRGSGPYEEELSLIQNGTATAPIKWFLNGDIGSSSGVIVRAGDDLNEKTGAEWILSSSGTNEYYFTVSGLDPSLSEVKSATVNNYFRLASAGESARERGSAGSLSANLEWAWGDNDTLGFSTFYIKCDSGTPADLEIIVSQRFFVLDQNKRNHQFYDADFRYGNEATVRSRHSVGHFWQFFNPFIAFANNNGFMVQADGSLEIFNPRGAWCGHRFVSVQSTADCEVAVYGGVERGAHLSARIDAATLTGSVNFYNFIGADQEAGAYEADSSAVLMNSKNCCWYPRMLAAGGALGYLGTANWPRTDISDIPSYMDTTESDQANLTDPLFKTSTEGYLKPSDFELKQSSPLKGRGAGYRSEKSGSRSRGLISSMIG
ncbi:MAG: hypothetical protein KJN67_05700 [Pontiella sp.]|nr:hypothetical protein [Pontiella sp.]